MKHGQSLNCVLREERRIEFIKIVQSSKNKLVTIKISKGGKEI